MTDELPGAIEKLIALRATALFGGLTQEALYPVGEIAQPVALAAGEVAVREGDPGDALYVVTAGRLALTRGGAAAGDLGPGAVFGEMAILDGAPRAATVTAATAARLLRISRHEFEALLDESPELVRGVISTLLGHLGDAD